MSLSQLHADLATAASAAAVDLSHAELHGTVCGMLIGNLRVAGLEAGSVPFDPEAYIDLVGPEAVQDAATLEDFAGIALAALDAQDLSFTPLLPADAAPIGVRVEALGEWCAAFLAGLGAVANTDLSESEAEVLDDFVAISAVDADVDDDDDAERQLMELVEYVRVAVLSLMMPAGEGAE